MPISVVSSKGTTCMGTGFGSLARQLVLFSLSKVYSTLTTELSVWAAAKDPSGKYTSHHTSWDVFARTILLIEVVSSRHSVLKAGFV